MLNINSSDSTDIPAILEPWLKYDQPLTDKLRELSGDAQIELLSQDWSYAKWWEKYALDLNEELFQREIFMKSHGKVYWYARTIVPCSTYKIEPNFFERLKTESVRNLIFDEPKAQFLKRTIYAINDQSIEFHWMKKYLTTLQGEFWVRLAEYSFQEQGSFYLIEILFPTLKEFQL